MPHCVPTVSPLCPGEKHFDVNHDMRHVYVENGEIMSYYRSTGDYRLFINIIYNTMVFKNFNIANNLIGPADTK